MEIRSLDLDKINKRISGFSSTSSALKDVSPIDLPQSVFEGKERINITKAEKIGDTLCVKLETSSL